MLDTRPPQLLEHSFVVWVSDAGLLGSFLEVSGLGLEYETYEYPEGGNNTFVHRLRGRLKQSNLTLRSGLADRAVLLRWMLRTDGVVQDMQLSFVSPLGVPLQRFGFAKAVPVRWTGPQANIAANAVATESLEIAHQGMRLL